MYCWRFKGTTRFVVARAIMLVWLEWKKLLVMLAVEYMAYWGTSPLGYPWEAVVAVHHAPQCCTWHGTAGMNHTVQQQRACSRTLVLD